MQIALALDSMAPMQINVFPEGLALLPFLILLFFELAQNEVAIFKYGGRATF